jgi:hypothetical protein
MISNELPKYKIYQVNVERDLIICDMGYLKYYIVPIFFLHYVEAGHYSEGK